MANLKENPSYKANVGYSGFDMSQLKKFSSTVGELLPIYYDFLQPGDKVSIGTEIKTRTMVIETAAMCSIDEHIDWFFVPLQQIYTPFGSWYNQINDIKSSLIDPTETASVFPYFNAANLLSAVSAVISTDSTSPVFTDDFGKYNTSFRLFEMLGCNSIQIYQMQNEGTNTSSLNPMLFCAYQKIYADCYALKDRERIYPSAWSLDKYYNTGLVLATDAPKIFKLHYRPWARDFFTNSFVSPIFSDGDLSSLNLQTETFNLSNSFQQWLVDDLSYYPAQPDGESANQNDGTSVVPDVTGSTTVSSLRGSVQQYLSPTSLRTSFAVQKLLEVTRRAGKHVDAQQLAHFGVKMPTGISGETTFIGGGVVSSIHIGDVIATASTDDSALGQVGGKGYGYGKGKRIKFEAPAHGILMGIYSAVPKADYNNYGLDRINTYINLNDFPRSEFDNLGMQPLFKYQGSWDITSATDNATILAWQYRWSELKSKPNLVMGALKNSLYNWSPARTFSLNTLASYLINPNYLDNIMLVSYNPNQVTAGAEFDTDPLIHELYIDCKKASKMSTYGLESL